jgi:tetratricopeptide (TPR) repeat protein
MIVALLLLMMRFGDLLRPTNAHAANAKGVKAFAKKQYSDAERAFAQANALRPSPSAAFNSGTAKIAAGHHAEGSAALEQAFADPKLRADALYNRGNSALLAKAYDYAVRDYTAALRLRPNDAQAKRNLEIALQKAAQQGSSGNQNNDRGQKPQPKPGSNGKNGEQPQRPKDGGNGDATADALLRAVQQQEKEELSRMRHARPEERKIGW